HYIIYRDGASYATSTTTTYTDTSGIAAGTRHSYQIVAVNPSATASAMSSALSVAPLGITATACLSPTSIQIVFSEAVDPASAQLASNYAITGSPAASVTAAVLQPDNATVILTTTAINGGRTLTVNGVKTLAGAAFPNTSATVTYQGGMILREVWTNISGTAISNLTSAAGYPNSPNIVSYQTSFEAPINWADNYGTRMRGYVLPTVTGNYNLYIASDDNGQLWLSTDDNPANKVLIATVSSWTNSEAWTTYAEQESTSIPLVAGHRYYIEALQKEGGGGDNLSVAWQLNGGAIQGPIPGTYLAPYVTPATTTAITVGVNALGTSDNTPPLSGTVSSTTAGITVGVGSRFYAATNNGNGTWTLPDNVIQPALADGTYTVSVSAIDSSTTRGFGSTTNQLIVDRTIPTATITPVTPNPRATAVDTATVVFSEPVTGFDVADIHLTRSGSSDLITNAVNVSTTDHITWTVTGLTALTAADGSYTLTLSSLGSGIVDGGNNQLAANASATWTVASQLAAPTATITPVTPGIRNSAVPSMTIVFSKAITGFNLADLTLKCNGGANLLTSSQSLTTSDNQTYTLSGLAPLTSAAGVYTLALTAAGSGISDTSGHALVADAFGTFTVDLTAPTVSITPVSPTLRNSPVSSMNIVFSEAVAGFNLADLSLTRNGVPVSLASLSTADNQTYTLTGLAAITNVTGTYVLTLQVAGSGITDLAGNALTGNTLTSSFTVDVTPPTVTIAPVTPNPRNSAVPSIAIVFSEPVTGFDLADLSLTCNGTPLVLTSLSTSDNTTFTLGNLTSLTGVSGSYALTLTAAGSGIIDLASNPLASNATIAWAADTVAPTAAIAAVSPNPRAAAVSSMTITFSKVVTGFAIADLSLTCNGTSIPLASASLGTLDNTTYTLSGLASLTAASGAYTLSLPAAAPGVTDLVGNALSNSASSSFTVDVTAPIATVTPPSPNPRNSAVSSLTIVFSKPVSGFVLADLTLKRGSLSIPLTALSSSDNTTYTLSGLSSYTGVAGTYTLTLTAAGSGITDALGNAMTANATGTWVVDTTAPTVISINRAGSTPTNATSLQYTVTFSENVTGVDATDFALALTGVTATIGTVTGSGTTYTVPITGVSGTGTLGLKLLNDHSIADLASNALAGTSF
ncbi:MAG: Ig-like domain-containing protein, partial [Tepidisphaeraceae bacterium]